MLNIFTSSRAPGKPMTSHLSNSAVQSNIYVIPRANTNPLRLNKNQDSFKDGAPIRVLDRFSDNRVSLGDNKRIFVSKKVKKHEVSPENELEDIEEHDGNKENYSINRIPVSPIAFKQMPNSSSRLNNSMDKRLDSCHLSTEPSIGNSSIHTTPSADPRRLSYFGEHRDQITNDLKPPSSMNEYQKQRLSTNSLSELDEKETPRRSKLIFYSASKERKNTLPAQMPSHHRELYSNSNFHGPIRADTGSLGSLDLENKSTYKSTEVSQIIKHTPTKGNAGSAEKPHRASAMGSDHKDMSYSLNNSQNKRYSCHKQSRSTAEKISQTSENFKKYLSNFNKLEHFDPKTWLKQVLTTNPRKKLQCSCDSNLSTGESCSRALGWLYKRYKHEEFGYLKSTYEKIVADNALAEPEQIKQIQKDIPRTYPSCKLFEPESEGAKSLERVLNAFAKYDPVVGYVQGMNFIAGSLLYHTEEYLAFWVLVSIFETLEMRDIYLPRLPGLSKHCQIIDMLMFNVLPNVYTKLCEFQIKAELFCSEWILTLFGSVVPIEEMGLIYDHLLADGWPFFYKLILAFLSHFSKEIEEQTDLIEVLTILKSQNHLPKNGSKTKSPYYIDWKVLCQKAQEIKIDSDFIYEMHLKFDINNLWFRMDS